ncbi:two-component sensor histidine kinase [Streptomyces sp. DH-12]|uniref:sensor histidine kinase n=1 Tax=Streptomyces sp. DH-12 TaxID=2072509 RepID=UPI000CCE810B|nr:histidine kinase [Streptomyces sp. DH-12]PNV34912.1 two-component sensor histidine kinase [Streptomyces sp. DH-12]
MAEESTVPVPWITPSGRYARALGRAIDVALALVVLLAAQRYTGDYDLLLGALMALALLARRRRPVTVMAVVLTLALVQFLLYEPYAGTPPASAPAAYDVAVLFAMMSVVHHSRTAWTPYAAGGVVLLATAATAVGAPFLGIEPFTDGGTLLVCWGLTLTVWLTAFALLTRRLYAESQAARARHAEREQEQRVRLAAARERAEIARELHDVVAHSLAVMILQADGAGAVLRKSPDMAESALRTIAATGRDAIDDMHRIVRVLREGQPEAGSAGEDRRLVTLDEIEVVADRARTAGLTVDLSVDVAGGRLSPAEEMTAFRIVQECLTNVLRHAGAGAAVDIRVREEDGALLIDVTDDGAGALAGRASVGTSGGNGLVGMRERVELTGGAFEAGPRLGSGWHVRASIPVRTKR